MSWRPAATKSSSMPKSAAAPTAASIACSPLLPHSRITRRRPAISPRTRDATPAAWARRSGAGPRQRQRILARSPGKTIMGMTIVEKILARASGKSHVAPGDVVTVKVDTVVLFDNNFMPSIYQDILKLEHPERLAVVLDHRVPAPTVQSASAHKTARQLVQKFGIKRFHDVGAKQGISHQVVADEAYALPGTVLVCSDSHTCSAGALNCAARGVGGPDVMYAACKGETWFRVGQTIRYQLEGKLPADVSMKDVFLHIAGKYGNHATQNVEFGGSALPGLSISARKTMSTMGAELSAEFATFECDEVLLDYVRARNPAPFEPQHPDADANYLEVRRIDLSSLEPLVALPDSV